MDLNHYKMYSVVSSTEDKQKNCVEEVLNSLSKLEELKDAKSAKKYLQEVYKIDENTRQFYILNQYPVKINETESLLSIKITLDNENISYNYRKEI